MFDFTSRKAAVVAASTLALIPAVASAATIDGGNGGERLRGTNAADVIDGNGGNDRISGRAGGDQLDGGLGKDRIYGNADNDKLFGGDSRDRIDGGSGNDESHGGDGNDVMAGGSGDDIQYGDAGNDTIYADAGVDRSYGGEGDDTLWAVAHSDVQPPAPGQVDTTGDTLDGGNGDDRIHANDGEVDRVTCGAGTDVAFLDTVDVVTDATAANPNGSCEKVVRLTPADDRAENATS